MKRKPVSKILAALSCFVVFCTVYALILPAITLEKPAFCEKVVHEHDQNCYVLTAATLNSSDSEQTNEPQLVCGKEEHQHSKQCYSNPNADIETREQWEGNIQKTLHAYEANARQRTGAASISNSTDPADIRQKEPGSADPGSSPPVSTTSFLTSGQKIAALAKSQEDYRESPLNYQVSTSKDGTETIHGWTRYGARYGTPYEPWSSSFIDFILEYSGLSPLHMPRNSEELKAWIPANTISNDLYMLLQEDSRQAADQNDFSDTSQHQQTDQYDLPDQDLSPAAVSTDPADLPETDTDADATAEADNSAEDESSAVEEAAVSAVHTVIHAIQVIQGEDSAASPEESTTTPADADIDSADHESEADTDAVSIVEPEVQTDPAASFDKTAEDQTAYELDEEKAAEKTESEPEEHTAAAAVTSPAIEDSSDETPAPVRYTGWQPGDLMLFEDIHTPGKPIRCGFVTSDPAEDEEPTLIIPDINGKVVRRTNYVRDEQILGWIPYGTWNMDDYIPVSTTENQESYAETGLSASDQTVEIFEDEVSQPASDENSEPDPALDESKEAESESADSAHETIYEYMGESFNGDENTDLEEKISATILEEESELQLQETEEENPAETPDNDPANSQENPFSNSEENTSDEETSLTGSDADSLTILPDLSDQDASAVQITDQEDHSSKDDLEEIDPQSEKQQNSAQTEDFLLPNNRAPDQQEEEAAEEDQEDTSLDSESIPGLLDNLEMSLSSLNKIHSLEFEGENHHVLLKYGEDANLPNDVELKVEEILPAEDIEETDPQEDASDTPAYEQLYENTAQALGKDSLDSVRFFDISLISQGQEIEPAASVDLYLTYSDENYLNEDNTESLSAVHFADQEEEPEVLDISIKRDALYIQPSSFSVYGIVQTRTSSNTPVALVTKIKVDDKDELYALAIPQDSTISLKDLHPTLVPVKSGHDGKAWFEAENPEDLKYMLWHLNNMKSDYRDVYIEKPSTNNGSVNFSNEPSSVNTTTLYGWESQKTIKVKEGNNYLSPGQDIPDLVWGAWNSAYNFEIYKIDKQLDLKPLDLQTIPGTTVKLFDYWLDKQETNDSGQGTGTNTHKSGINGFKTNKGTDSHQLLFRKDPPDTWSTINQWTGWPDTGKKLNPLQGIVEPVLTDGYPTIREATIYSPQTGSTNTFDIDRESLSYLFDETPLKGETEPAGKKAYGTVDGLLTKYIVTEKIGNKTISKEYVGYDSTKNFAGYNATKNRFDLFDRPAVDGQFFPFGTGYEGSYRLNELFENKNGKIQTINQNGESMSNHYFGITLETSFYQRSEYSEEDGEDHTGYYNGNPMVFNFSGDDDVWIFIDDVLVGDLGGIHSKNSVSIDFSTGEVLINNGNVATSKFPVKASTTIQECFEAAKKFASTNDLTLPNKVLQQKFEGEGTFIPDGTEHTLKMFYLERGHYESNLSMYFNLPPSALIVEKELTGTAATLLKDPDFEFELKKKVKSDTGSYTEEDLFPKGTSYQLVDTFDREKVSHQDTTVKDGGIITLKAGQKAVFNNVDPGTSYIIRERIFKEANRFENVTITTEGEETITQGFGDYETELDSEAFSSVAHDGTIPPGGNTVHVIFSNNADQMKLGTLKLTKVLKSQGDYSDGFNVKFQIFSDSALKEPIPMIPFDYDVTWEEEDGTETRETLKVKPVDGDPTAGYIKIYPDKITTIQGIQAGYRVKLEEVFPDDDGQATETNGFTVDWKLDYVDSNPPVPGTDVTIPEEVSLSSDETGREENSDTEDGKSDANPFHSEKAVAYLTIGTNQIYNITCTNSGGVSLPETGGSGTHWIIGAGCACLMLGLVLMIGRRSALSSSSR